MPANQALNSLLCNFMPHASSIATQLCMTFTIEIYLVTMLKLDCQCLSTKWQLQL